MTEVTDPSDKLNTKDHRYATTARSERCSIHSQENQSTSDVLADFELYPPSTMILHRRQHASQPDLVRA
jgi:hypothetical protein